MYYEKYGRYWAVYDELDVLICITVYKKGAKEVIRRLALKSQLNIPDSDNPYDKMVNAWLAP